MCRLLVEVKLQQLQPFMQGAHDNFAGMIYIVPCLPHRQRVFDMLLLLQVQAHFPAF